LTVGSHQGKQVFRALRVAHSDRFGPPADKLSFSGRFAQRDGNRSARQRLVRVVLGDHANPAAPEPVARQVKRMLPAIGMNLAAGSQQAAENGVAEARGQRVQACHLSS
jgi:hypothetical protein